MNGYRVMCFSTTDDYRAVTDVSTELIDNPAMRPAYLMAIVVDNTTWQLRRYGYEPGRWEVQPIELGYS